MKEKFELFLGFCLVLGFSVVIMEFIIALPMLRKFFTDAFELFLETGVL